MFIPYAYLDIVGKKNTQHMMEILIALNRNHFNNEALIGPAEKVLNYKCPGTCLDYVYDTVAESQYVFGWEIFGQ